MTTLKVEKLSRPFFAQLWIFHPVGKFFANHVPNLYPEAGQKFWMIFFENVPNFKNHQKIAISPNKRQG